MNDKEYKGWFVSRLESDGRVAFHAFYATYDLAAKAVEKDIAELGGVYDFHDYEIEAGYLQLHGFNA